MHSDQLRVDSNAAAMGPAGRSRADYLGILAWALVACLLAALGWFRLGSLDTGYHVAYGSYFLDSGEIVDRDPFLYEQKVRPFVNANWGSQVVMAMVYRMAGANGLIGLRLVLLAVVFACIAIVVRRMVKSWFWVAAAWLLAAMAGYERFSMRPELFSYAVMMVMLVILTRGPLTKRGIVLLVLLQLIWVNLHSYFLVGLFLTGAVLAETLVRRVMARRDPREAIESNAKLKLVAAALLIQVVACCINPWHVRGAVFPLSTLSFLRGEDVMAGAAGDTSQSAWSEISEFQSPFGFGDQQVCYRTIEAFYVLLAVAVIGVVALAATGRLNAALMVLLFFLMATQMRRNIAQFAFVAAPLCLGAIGLLVRRASSNLLWEKRVHVTRIVALAAVIVFAGFQLSRIASGRFYYDERRITREFGTGFSDVTFPRQAVEWIAGQKALEPELFVDYFTSSNVLLWLPEHFKLFVDTNTFAYEDATLRQAFDVGLGRIPHGEFFRANKVNAVLLHAGPDTQMLIHNMVRDDGEWALVYFDGTAVVFVRRIQPHVPIIIPSQLSEENLDAKAWIASLSGPAYGKALRLGTAVNVPISLGWWRPAAELMEEAVRLAPDYHEAWINLGLCHAQLGNFSMRRKAVEEGVRHFNKAAECFEQALAIDPGNRIATANLERLRAAFGG